MTCGRICSTLKSCRCVRVQKRLLVKLEQRGAPDSSEGRAFLRQMRRLFDQMLSSRYLEEKNYLATKEMLHRLGHSWTWV